MDLDDNPLGLLIGGTFYFMLLMVGGVLMPWWYVSEWAPHAGLMKPRQLNVATSDVLPWYIGTAVFLAMLMASGYNRLAGRLASLMMLLFAYSVLLPVITATLLILPFNLIGLSNKRIEGFVHLGSIAGWTCYALYIFFAPPPRESFSATGGVSRAEPQS
jgi:hypothetical protein